MVKYKFRYALQMHLNIRFKYESLTVKQYTIIDYSAEMFI